MSFPFPFTIQLLFSGLILSAAQWSEVRLPLQLADQTAGNDEECLRVYMSISQHMDLIGASQLIN